MPTTGYGNHPFDKSLIDHAERCWKAECENAERITKERHLATTVLIAFLGLGLFKIDWLQAVVARAVLKSHWLSVTAAIVICLLLVVAIVYFVWALFSLAHKPERETASAHLSLPKGVYYPAGQLTEDEQKRFAFARTYRAYQVLQARNELARGRMTAAWTRFGIGIALVGVVISIYILCATWTIVTSPAEVTSGNPNSNAPHAAADLRDSAKAGSGAATRPAP